MDTLLFEVSHWGFQPTIEAEEEVPELLTSTIREGQLSISDERVQSVWKQVAEDWGSAGAIDDKQYQCQAACYDIWQNPQSASLGVLSFDSPQGRVVVSTARGRTPLDLLGRLGWDERQTVGSLGLISPTQYAAVLLFLDCKNEQIDNWKRSVALGSAAQIKMAAQDCGAFTKLSSSPFIFSRVGTQRDPDTLLDARLIQEGTNASANDPYNRAFTNIVLAEARQVEELPQDVTQYHHPFYGDSRIVDFS